MRQLLWVWMLLVALAFINDRCYCCLQEERSGLLEIKAWFGHASDGSYRLEDWDKEDLNCCNWDRVACDSTTNRVIQLDLSGVNYDALEDLYLNASLFLPFKELVTLDLNSNQLVGGLKNQGFQGLASGLRKLKILNLRDNKFNDSILSSLSGFSTLKSLDLSYNSFTGTIGLRAFQGLASGLRKLEDLPLGYNKFNDNILSSLSGFSTLKSLDLSNNSFTGTIGLRGLRKLEVLILHSIDFKENILLESLGGLPSLKILSAIESKFEGKHFGKGLCNSTSLEKMYFLGSSLPASFLGNIGTPLKVLDLTGVDFHDTLHVAQALQNLTKLEELFLGHASPITTSFLRIIGSLPALRYLSLEGCKLTGTLPHQGWCELKNLEWLSLGQNNLKGVLPPCLGNLSSLRNLDLSDNQFEGHISYLPQLEYLSISNNYFQVPISFVSFMNHSNLKYIACDNNELVPASSFQAPAPKLQLRFFSASSCTSKLLSCEFPTFLHSQYDLVFVDLSHNKFIGEPFPSWLVENNTKLNRLYLSNTSFIGPLQLPQNPRPNLDIIDLSDNSIHGQVARNTCLIFPSLQNFIMANNNLTGCIPLCFGNMSSLAYLDLSNNHMSCELLENNLPLVGSSLWYLKLSNNNFTGLLPPSVFNMTKPVYLFLDGNKFAGEVPRIFSPTLQIIDISNNLLSGMLPRGIGNSSVFLKGIDLSKNHLEDLGDNNLTGPIPDWIDSLSELSIFDLKSNQFKGELLKIMDIKAAADED